MPMAKLFWPIRMGCFLVRPRQSMLAVCLPPLLGQSVVNNGLLVANFGTSEGGERSAVLFRTEIKKQRVA